MARLPDELVSHGLSKVLLITDRSLVELGLPNKLLQSLHAQSIECTVYDAVDPNPSIQNVEGAVKSYQQNNCEGVIVFGGGSPIDCGKAAAALVSNPGKSLKQLRGNMQVKQPIVPLFAVPTTAGTGSETTVGAVITDIEAQIKFAISGNALVPLVAVLDPELTMGLPPSITAATGMDALTHAVESYIGTIARQADLEKSERATKLIFENLETVYQDGSRMDQRDNMLHASFLAAESFNRGLLGYVHAIAETLGALYGIPHGVANAVILPHVLEFSRDNKLVRKRLARLARVTGIDEARKSDEELTRIFIDKVKRMNQNMDMPEHFDALEENDVAKIVRRSLDGAHRDYGVPKIMSEHECERLVSGLMKAEGA